MKRAAAKLLLLIIIAAVASSSLSIVTHARRQPQEPVAANATSASCRPHERDALLAFKHGITEDDYGFLASWHRGQDCCKWSGITCNSQTGHVVELDLWPTKLAGQISPSLLSLEYLEYLDLSGSFLQGPNQTVPEFLGFMNNLIHLDLSSIPFSGAVPPLLFKNLTKLEYLNLSNTSLSGNLPPQLGNLTSLRYLEITSWMPNLYSSDISWLANLRYLEYIDLTGTNLSTVIDYRLVANMIPTLKNIILADCSLPSAKQSIPNMNLTTLEELDLSLNNFGHSFVSCWFWNITSIKSLNLRSTYLGGRIPDSLGEMVSLQVLDFRDNGNAATMTVDLTKLCELEILLLDGSLSSGNITEFVEKLPRCSVSLYILSSAGNNMTGVLPNVIGHLTQLVDIYLSNNSISGAVPPEIRNLSSLNYLGIRSNQLSGQIPLLPTSIRTLDISMNCLSGNLPLTIGAPNLANLLLASNYFTGEVPVTICQSRNMQILDLSHNFFEGELPRCSSMKGMAFLVLGNNSFSGMFPSWIRSFSSMIFLDLSWNKFNGKIPRWIGDLANLRFLHLSHNMFCGDIPQNITDLKLLQYLNLAANNMSGSMHLSWSKLVKMTLKHPVESLNDINDTGVEPGLILSLVMKHNLLSYKAAGIERMVGIDLSLNYLRGEIPDEITSLDRLCNLNLSYNQLSGKIPKNIGSMKLMESLDLSRNRLHGEIPPSLSDLTYLGSLDLSDNNLTGRIPSGRQLDTLYAEDPSIYDGNSGLCGPPLQRNCSGSSSSTKSGSEMRSEENDSEQKFIYFGFASGFTVGLWVVFCALLFKKSWRVSYYRLFDRACDRAYVCIAVTWGRLLLARQATTAD